jgi:hypothetical protein
MSNSKEEIIFKEDEQKDSGVMFYEKHKFTLHGFTMFEILQKQEEFKYIEYFKRSVCRIDISDLKEKYKHPLIIDIKEKIEELYGMRVLGVFLNLYEGGYVHEGDDYAQYYKDKCCKNGIFTVSVGGLRMLYIRNENTNIVTKHLLEDGDLFFFNNDFNNINKYSIPKLKKYRGPRISIVFFV